MSQYSKDTPRHAMDYVPAVAKSKILVIALYSIVAIVAMLVLLEPR